MTAPTLTQTEGRKKFLHYVFTTALEGGISYWAQTETYRWSNPNRRPESTVMDTDYLDLDGFCATITSAEDEWGIPGAFQWMAPTDTADGYEYTHRLNGNEDLRIDIRTIQRGVDQLVENVMAAVKSEDPDAPFSRDYLRQFVIQYLTNGEDGDSDADVCDMVVQLGLFGELVYA